jgi:hypothetical protein
MSNVVYGLQNCEGMNPPSAQGMKASCNLFLSLIVVSVYTV